MQRLCKRLGDLDSITAALENNLMSVAGAGDAFNAILEDFSRLNRRIGTDVPVVDTIHFKNAVVKVQSNCKHYLTANKSSAIKMFKILDVSEPSTESRKLSLVERARKRAKMQELS